MGERKAFNLLLLGTAGSGKTHACAGLLALADSLGIDAAVVNLDPGAESMPYEPSVDVRDWVDIHELMRERGLGPNGAQIAAADMTAVRLPEVMEAIEAQGAELNLFDTPGQMELFAFRPASVHLVDKIGKDSSMLVFLHDSAVVRDPRNLVSDLLLSSAAQMRLGAPSAHLLSKADLLSEEEVRSVEAWTEDPDALRDALEGGEDDAGWVYARSAAMAFEGVLGGLSLIPFSAEEPEGGEKLMRLVGNTAGWDDDEESREKDGD